MSFILTKFFEKKEYRNDFLNGKLYFSSLNEFSDIKPISQEPIIINGEPHYQIRNIDQRDPGEGIIADVNASQQSLEMLFPNTLNNKLNYFARLRSLGYSYCNIMSFHKIELTFQITEYGYKKFYWDETNMNNFGKYAAVITNPKRFLRKLRTALDKTNWDYIFGSVKYHKPTTQEMQEPNILLVTQDTFSINQIENLLNTQTNLTYDAFDKFTRYKNQKEWRLLINRNEVNNNCIKYLEIGDLSDCVKKVDITNFGNFIDKSLSNKTVLPLTNDNYDGNLSRKQMREKVISLGQNKVQVLLTLIPTNNTANRFSQ